MLTQSCAHAMLLCVKPQEAALARAQLLSVRTPLARHGGEEGEEEEEEKKERRKTPLCTSRPSLLPS